MKTKYTLIGILMLLTISFTACEKLIPPPPAEDELLDGPVEGLTTAEHARFLAGDVAFNNEVFTAQTGLGPFFVATSCASCHAGDGKGHPFTTLTRFGQSDTLGNTFLDKGGPQLQNRAIPGYHPEKLPAGATFSNFMPPANTGLGFLAALTDAQLLAIADPNDLNGDGISGRPNYIDAPSYFTPQSFHIPMNGRYIGRFGKKAAAIDLLHQTVNAYNQDMGITSTFNPIDQYTQQTADPEVSDNVVHDVVFYLRTLKAPIQRTPNNTDIVNGRVLFASVGCAQCHTPQWTTPASDIEALSNKTFYPYTDLLLHDMGPALDDNYTEGIATTSEWRTPPLWGIGLSPNSQGGNYFLMHDGRARTINEAILLHGGEATGSTTQYKQLTEAEKALLIKFIESL
ncbi:di-heme oxidoredictase family protein [Oscillatoria amoena NRMC-F 0135]|nr:di-heme oxidoredictase family protein [Oscillatoria amoena NRMC-F 0135]